MWVVLIVFVKLGLCGGFGGYGVVIVKCGGVAVNIYIDDGRLSICRASELGFKLGAIESDRKSGGRIGHIKLVFARSFVPFIICAAVGGDLSVECGNMYNVVDVGGDCVGIALGDGILGTGEKLFKTDCLSFA